MNVPTIQPVNNTPAARQSFETDKIAVENCIDRYGNFVWAMARKFTASRQAAETATQEIFSDIWKYSERSGEIRSLEEKIVSRIALRRLMRDSR